MKATNQKKTFRADTEGVRKLTKSAQRKLTVTCIAIAAIALILLGAGLSYFHGQDAGSASVSLEEMQSSLKEQLRREMEQASESLLKLDGSIAQNQQKLEEVNRQLTERQESLLEVETTQKKLEENTSDVSVRVLELEKKTETQIGTLQNNMSTIHTDVRSAVEKITSILETLEKTSLEDAAEYTKYMEELSRVNLTVQQIGQSIEQVQEQLGKNYESLKSMMTDMRAEEESLRELVKAFHREENSGQEETLARLTALIEQLTGVENSLKTLLEADMTQIAGAFDTLNADIQVRLNQLSQFVDGRIGELDQNMSGSFANLGENMSGSFANLGENMSGSFADLDRNVSGGLENLGQSVTGRIDDLNQNMNGGLESLGQNVSGSLSDLGQKLDGGLGSLDQSVGSALENLGQDINSQFQTVNRTLIQQITELESSSGQSSDELIRYLESMNASWKQDMNQVFTSVSDGKKRLASALLTKGVSVEDDAAFARIADAILGIEQKVVIGVTEIPGTISYHYHYHTDASGQNPHAETSSTEGGCFTAAKYHSHGEDCYTVEYYHTHTSDCPYQPVWVDWVENPYWGADYLCNDQPLNRSRRVLVCTKNGSTVDEYLPSCGLMDGQIIGAEIVYDRASVTAAAAWQQELGAQQSVPQEETALPQQNAQSLPPRLSREEAEALTGTEAWETETNAAKESEDSNEKEHTFDLGAEKLPEAEKSCGEFLPAEPEENLIKESEGNSVKEPEERPIKEPEEETAEKPEDEIAAEPGKENT